MLQPKTSMCWAQGEGCGGCGVQKGWGKASVFPSLIQRNWSPYILFHVPIRPPWPKQSLPGGLDNLPKTCTFRYYHLPLIGSPPPIKPSPSLYCPAQTLPGSYLHVFPTVPLAFLSFWTSFHFSHPVLRAPWVCDEHRPTGQPSLSQLSEMCYATSTLAPQPLALETSHRNNLG